MKHRRKIRRAKAEFNLDFPLMPKQLELLNSQEKLVACIGGYGSSKTYSGSVAFLHLCLLNGPTTSIIAAPTYGMLTSVVLPMFRRHAQDLIEYENLQDHLIILKNGAEIRYGSTERPQSLEGLTVSHIWLDECAYVSKESFTVLLGRLREQNCVRRQFIMTGTPTSGGWLRETFEGRHEDRKLIRMSSRDNPFLPADFVETLEASYSASRVATLVDGEWYHLSDSAIFPEFSRERHILHDWHPPKGNIVCGIDFGFSHPAALFGQLVTTSTTHKGVVIPAGSLVVFDQDCTNQIGTDTLAMRIAQRYPQLGPNPISMFAVDPAGNVTNTQGVQRAGTTDVTALKVMLMENGYVKPNIKFASGKGSQIIRQHHTGLEQMRGMLANAKGETRLFFASSLLDDKSGRGIVKSMEMMQYRKGTDNMLRGEPAFQLDHINDALRYLIRHLYQKHTPASSIRAA